MLSYRKDIDGLRGIAILLVILFHYKVPGFEGGFIGVDIFFVISGYLISSIIQSRLSESNFSFASFYAGRIRRILPPLYTVIIASLLFSWCFLDSDFLKELAKTSGSAVLFFSNVFFYKTTGSYFAQESGANILLHTWSLSLEEQFYLIFPPLIYFLYKYARKNITHFIAAIALLSVVISVAVTRDHAVFAFYLPFTRSWEFLAGVLVARIHITAANRYLKNTLSLLGVALIIAGLISLDTKTAFPGYHALFPVVGAALILQSSLPAIVNNLLCFRPLVFIGKISYSLYLWHWPVLVFSEYFIYDTFRLSNMVIPLLLTLILSIVSWRYVEQSFRSKSWLNGNYKKVFWGAVCFSVLLVGISLVITVKEGFPGRSRQNALWEEIKADSTWLRIWRYHHYTVNRDSLSDLMTIGSAQVPPDFLLWGDSHAGTLLGGFEAACLEKHKSGYVAITVGDAPVLPGKRRTNDPNLANINLSIIRFIATHPEIRKVFLTARWTASRNEIKEPFDKELFRTIDTLVQLNKEVVIISPTPEINIIPKKYFFQHNFLHKDINELTPAKAAFLHDNNAMFALMEQLGKLHNVHVLSIYEPFFRHDRTLLLDQNRLLFLDEHHLSLWGSLKTKNIILGEL